MVTWPRSTVRALITLEMTEEQLSFVEELGVVFEQSGAAPMLGRVYGALLISPVKEMTAEDFATILHASRGSISQATRQLVDMGMLRRTHKLGSRKDYFQLAPGGWAELSRQRFQKADVMSDIFRRGLETTPEPSPEARAHLEENLLFLEYWQEMFDQFFIDWQKRKEDLHAKRNPDD